MVLNEYELLCCADIPASRKLSGFIGHSALKACSKCLKSFPTDQFGSKADYSGFNRGLWPKQDSGEHKLQGLNWKHANTLAKQHEIEREFGIRFTELIHLPYFDTVRFTVIDPMHNILLGSAKHIIHLWKGMGLLNEFRNQHIQIIVDKFVCPPDV